MKNNISVETEPGHGEKTPAAIQSALEIIQKKKEQDSPFKVGKDSEGNQVTVEEPTMELQSFQTFGTVDPDCLHGLLNQVILGHPETKKTNLAYIVNKTTPLLHAIAPRNELEGMLAVQMVSVHNLVMEIMKRAVRPNQNNDDIKQKINMVTKLNRTFVAQIEALNKHRGKGQQKMTVEHVHVSDGGQAVIGNVDRGQEGKK